MSSSLSSRLNLSNLSLPPATKALLILLTVGSLLLQFLKRHAYNALVASGESNVKIDLIIVPSLQLLPNHTLLHPWTLLTAIFVDASIARFLVSLVLMYFAGRFIERCWSSKELIKFVCLVGAVSNLATSISIIFINIIIQGEFANVAVDGNLCLLISYLVILRQLIPEHSIVLFKGVAQFRVKHIPFVTLLILTTISIVTVSLTPAIQAWIGLVISWTYLRFFQTSVADPLLPQPNNVIGVRKLHGDASETFSFVHFFPDVLQPILAPIFDNIFEIMVQFGLLQRFNDSDIEQGNLIASRRLTGQTSEPVDSRNAAERRRQVALKVLEERIGTGTPSAVPTTDGSKTQSEQA